MGYVNVKIITPDGSIFRAEVDETAEADSLLSDLVAHLALPTETGKGEPIKYRLLLAGLRFGENSTLKIEQVTPSEPIRIIRRLE